jgi:hypothetical protein
MLGLVNLSWIRLGRTSLVADRLPTRAIATIFAAMGTITVVAVMAAPFLHSRSGCVAVVGVWKMTGDLRPR